MISASAEVAHRVVDEAAGRKTDVSVCMPVRPGRSSSSASSTPLGDLERVRARELLDHQHQPVAAVDTASPISGWWSSTMSATSPRRSRPPVPSTGTFAELLGVGDLVEHVADLQALAGRLDEAAGARGRGLEEAQRRHDLGVAGRRMTWLSVTSLSRSRARVDLDLQLLLALAPDRHVGDAGNAHQARPDRPAGDDRLLDRRELLGGQADHQHAARRRERLQQRRAACETFGQRVRLREPLLRRAGARGRCPCPARRSCTIDDRPGTDSERMSSTPSTPLSRSASSGTVIELLDLLGREPERLGLDLGVGRRELRQDVDRRAAQLHDAERRSPPAATPTMSSRNRRLERTTPRITPRASSAPTFT